MWRHLLPLLLSVASGLCACDADWKEYKGDCFKLFTNIRPSYSEAGVSCKAENGFLTEVQDVQHQTFLRDEVITPANSGLKIWVGLKHKNGTTAFIHPLIPGVIFEILNRGYMTEFFPPGVECAAMESGLGLLEVRNCADVKDGYICKKGEPLTTPKPTTTTKKPTPPPTIADPKKWIIDPKLGTQIHRSHHSGRQTHHYTLDWNTTPAGFEREGGPGYVVSEARFPQIKATCPNLIKVGIWRSGTISYIGNNPPAGFVRKESFYCANRQFDCGANHLLRQLDKQGGGDIFYASDENEAHMQLLGYGTKNYVTNWFPETPCWVWKDIEDTWYTIVRANGGMIWGGYHFNAFVHFYTLQRHLTPGGFEKTAGPGYIVNQDLYDSYFKKECPELVRARIWHGQNSKNELVTWIGREGRSPPAAMRNGKPEDLWFYCAPRANYCNANFLLRRMDKTDGTSFFYPQDEKEAWEQLRGAEPGMFKNTKWSEEVCYIWQRW